MAEFDYEFFNKINNSIKCSDFIVSFDDLIYSLRNQSSISAMKEKLLNTIKDEKGHLHDETNGRFVSKWKDWKSYSYKIGEDKFFPKEHLKDFFKNNMPEDIKKDDIGTEIPCSFKDVEALMYLYKNSNENNLHYVSKVIDREDLGMSISVAFGKNNDENKGHGLKHFIDKHLKNKIANPTDDNLRTFFNELVSTIKTGIPVIHASHENLNFVGDKWLVSVSLDWFFRNNENTKFMITGFKSHDKKYLRKTIRDNYKIV